ncbi:MAG TPA: hypothetical protein VF773_18530 [Verrucomicrobiae bacterium]
MGFTVDFAEERAVIADRKAHLQAGLLFHFAGDFGVTALQEIEP